MKVLITSSRMPFALGMVRQLADAGHEVYAADDYARLAGQPLEVRWPGTSSTRRPRHETEAFVDEIERIVDEHEIDVVVPAFEEASSSPPSASGSRARRRSSRAQFAGPRAAARQGGVRAPRPPASACRSPRRSSPPPTPSSPTAIERFDRYFGRAVFSRGGVDLLTNTGPLAGVARSGRRAPDAGRAVADPAVRRGRDGLHLLDRPRGHGQLAPDVPDPAPVAPLDRDPVRVDRRDASRCG